MNQYCLSKASIASNDDCYDFEKIRLRVFDNLLEALRSLHYFAAGKTVFADDFSLFSLDGSICVSPKYFEDSANDFFLGKPRRSTLYRGKYALRGTNYTIASNPTFELRQKLDILREDFNEGMGLVSSQTSLIFQAAIADYIKNAAVTLMNSFLYDEKVGKYRLDDHAYQSIRRASQALCEASVKLFYCIMLRDYSGADSAYLEISSKKEVISKLCRHIEDRYSQGVFSSRHITRPEASHPGIIALSAISAVRKMQAPDLIVGMPSGSTELAMAHKVAWKMLAGRDVPILLLPISLHSAKHDFDVEPAGFDANLRFVRRQKQLINMRRVHIIDDNSSTGQTVELAARLLKTQLPREIKVIVAEADILRSQLSIESTERKFIASPLVYNESVTILPVSRRIFPKHDIKEIIERRKMIASVRRRYFLDSAPAHKEIIGRAYLSLFSALSKPSSRVLSNADGIFGFKGTFLSNFYPASIECNETQYGSVEHAYQAMKFSHVSKVEVSEQDLSKINRALSKRGEQVSRSGIADLFESGLTPGSTKIVGNHLRRLGYVRKDWDYIKVDVMTLLLCQKFADEDLYSRLAKTGDAYLEESNDWGDTFWGVCDTRGRNMLGHLLFHIREYRLQDLQSLAVGSIAELLSLARTPRYPVVVAAYPSGPVPPPG